MTINQLLHHQEQMEAVRRDFHIALPLLLILLKKDGIHLPRPAAEDLLWKYWLEDYKKNSTC